MSLAEAFSSGIAGFVIRVGQLSLVQVCSLLLEDDQSSTILWLFTGLQLLAFLSILFVKQNLERRFIDESPLLPDSKGE